MNGAPETRAVPELRVSAAGGLTGYAAVFNLPSRDLGGFVETVLPGAFSGSLADGSNILALYEHDLQRVLGRVGAGTLTLEQDARGLRFDIDLPEAQYARDLLGSVKRGDVTGGSFGFRVPDGGESWTERDDGTIHRALATVELMEITVTSMPAYTDTAVAMRHWQALRPATARSLTLRLLELESS